MNAVRLGVIGKISMALEKRTKGGCGGKKGHSNMSHYNHTEVIKKAHKKHLRRESKNLSNGY
jgi:hypothetical protein